MEGTEAVTTGDKQGIKVHQPQDWQSLPSLGGELCQASLDAQVRFQNRGTRGACVVPAAAVWRGLGHENPIARLLLSARVTGW